ncbi:hypothetical protein Tco_0787230 [Tanacetum coccineum]
MTAFETRVRQDTNEIYTRLDDEQSVGQIMLVEVYVATYKVRSSRQQIRELQSADRRRQTTTDAEFEDSRERKGPAQPELPEEAGKPVS